MKLDKYRLREIVIGGGGGCKLYVSHLTDKYVRLSTRKGAKITGFDLEIYFDLEDEDDIKLREDIRKVYDWHFEHCKPCKIGKEMPTLSYELTLKATLEELAGMVPLSPKIKHAPPKEIEIGDWFWQLEKIPTPAELYNNPELTFVGPGVDPKNKEKC